jgi:hypothetical protein
MEILYLWVNNGKGITNFGLNLSNRYTFEFDKNSLTLTVTDNRDFEQGFWGETVSNLTALVGKNGAGKNIFHQSHYQYF